MPIIVTDSDINTTSDTSTVPTDELVSLEARSEGHAGREANQIKAAHDEEVRIIEENLDDVAPVPQHVDTPAEPFADQDEISVKSGDVKEETKPQKTEKDSCGCC